ncbi:unnamed protein product [Allacma fusca]|uniref:Uncharacterized protein n=1 Tax=Allacma fusca TaxID=39272 RepID=A0A8J2PW31_9HEXA|nr:unnamed protein product [Allacma fusca]
MSVYSADRSRCMYDEAKESCSALGYFTPFVVVTLHCRPALQVYTRLCVPLLKSVIREDFLILETSSMDFLS